MKRSLIILIVLLFFSCTLFEDEKKDNTARQQETIEWPSLANSAWPMHAHDPQHTGRSIYAGATHGTVEWSNRLDYSTDGSSPILGEDGIYIGTSRDLKSVFKVTESGVPLWDTPLVGAITSSPIISSSGNLFVSTNGFDMNAVHCLNSDGNIVWQLETPTKNKYYNPVLDITGQYLYLILQNDILKINANTGSITDSITVGGNVVFRGMSPAFVTDGSVFYVTGATFANGWVDGNLSLFAFDTIGNHLWSYETGLEDDNFRTSYPSINNEGTIFFQFSTNQAAYVYAINPDGTLMWQFEDAASWNFGFNGISIGNYGDLYLINTDGEKLLSLDANGILRWEFFLENIYTDPSILNNFPKFSEIAPVIDKDDNVFVAMAATYYTDTLNFAVYDKDGQLLSTLALKNDDTDDVRDIYSMPTIGSDGSIYIAVEDGRVYKVR